MLTVRTDREAVHAADEPPDGVWLLPDDAGVGDLIVHAVGARYFPSPYEVRTWTLSAGRRTLARVEFRGHPAELVVSTAARTGQDALRRVLRSATEGLYWSHREEPRSRWWRPATRFRVDPDVTARARAAAG